MKKRGKRKRGSDASPTLSHLSSPFHPSISLFVLIPTKLL